MNKQYTNNYAERIDEQKLQEELKNRKKTLITLGSIYVGLILGSFNLFGTEEEPVKTPIENTYKMSIDSTKYIPKTNTSSNTNSITEKVYFQK